MLELIAIFATLAHYLGRGIELRIHRFNVDFMEFVSAEVRGTNINRAFLLLITIAPIVFLIEYGTLWPKLSTKSVLIALPILALSLFLRLWAIDKLGRMWSLKIMFVPGAEQIKDGPFRLFKHPEYLSRFLDLLGLGLLWQAHFSLVLIVPIFIVITVLCVRAEKEQLGELSQVPQ